MQSQTRKHVYTDTNLFYIFVQYKISPVYTGEILFDIIVLNRPVAWSHAMLHLCFLAQPFTLANLPVVGVVQQVLL